MRETLSVRPLEQRDFAGWNRLWLGYNAFYGREGGTALPDEVTRTTWARFFDPYEPMFALVAESEGALLGLTHFILHRSTSQIQPNCYLQDLFTAEAARGKGVARALINAVYERAQNLGLPRVYWNTHETNLTTMQLYDKLADRSGFVMYRKIF
ncbi:GNAT family N-acetyltransferase [Serratia entomophila]|uniref:GNAT family N-acetyltransferase n=1 Tax=Serratia entomophila TaxID=42906 RepID=UPI00217B5D21|nr:GNAT family N-acetyltransferase [Serratia entomophila]CAI0901265.1 Acetyltransferase (GNAT) family [Serratia entomophila]CAI1538402.1 Acetyltransferase (GNAT) family [Serratia entomophila]CAI1588430.1 Acetyltransferase (GNAT) family [Serratia entomophila]CAI1595072.1 Acetyltransferase (GNAT) family [Serratia entomophila]CAI1596625.1 Acetyltransferase (GNAT) family [Serratia entomophila]